MKRKYYTYCIFGVFFLFSITWSGCAPKRTRLSFYPKMYEETPLTVLVMPPINETNMADAADLFYATLSQYIIERGYYVYPPFATLEFLRNESAAEAEPFLHASLKPFVSIMGADVLLFTTIKRWQKTVLLNTIDISAHFMLRSAKTQEVLFERDVQLEVDCSSSVSTGSVLVDLIANAVSTALTDKVVAPRRANAYVFSDMPVGKYHPDHMKDTAEQANPANVKGISVSN